MKRRFIDLIMIVAMAIIANYPMYETLRSTAEEMDLIVQAVQAEIIGVQEDVSVASEKINEARKEFYELNAQIKETIDNNIAVADSTLNQIERT